MGSWRRPHRVSKELRTLEAMYERLVKSLEAWLISRVRGQRIEVRLQASNNFFVWRVHTVAAPTPALRGFVFEIAGTGQKRRDGRPVPLQLHR
jgi:flagellar motor switch protein FliM